MLKLPPLFFLWDSHGRAEFRLEYLSPQGDNILRQFRGKQEDATIQPPDYMHLENRSLSAQDQEEVQTLESSVDMASCRELPFADPKLTIRDETLYEETG